jgi:hypothetical protein
MGRVLRALEPHINAKSLNWLARMITLLLASSTVVCRDSRFDKQT